MGAFVDLTGKRFGRITIVKRVENRKNKTMWEYICDCGKYGTACAGDIVSGRMKSCGCYNKEVITKHGLRNTRIYQTYYDMIERCGNPNNNAYKNYGARGISVCQEWKEGFESFYNWAIANGYNDNLTIDRIDVNGNYCPENCRWVSKLVQANNTRRNVYVEACGKVLTYAQWSRILGISRQNVQKGVLKHGISYIEKKWDEMILQK